MRWAFVVAALGLSGAIVLSRPPLRDPDSTLYAAMSSQLSTQPLRTWIAPEWPPGRMKSGPFVEHTAVSAWPGAALERVQPGTGALLANALGALLLLWLVGRLAEVLAPGGAAVGWAAWGLSLIGVQYWLRANHEIWWAAAAIAALLSVASRAPRWLAVACTVLAFSVKGPLGLDVALLVAPLAWVTQGRRWLLRYLVNSALAVLVFAASYELVYREVTGASFIGGYVTTQLGYVLDSEAAGWLAKPRNLAVYAGKLLWFSLPGALLLAWALRKGPTRELRALVVGVVAVLLVTSLMSRQAGRYIFPCYVVLAVVGAASAAGSKLGVFLAGRARLVFALVCLVALGRILLASAVYREVNFFPGTRVTVRPADAG